MQIRPADLSKKDTHELMFSTIAPRPVVLVSTIGESGILNVAPYSCFGPLGLKPALIYVGITYKRDGQKKDTLINIESSKDFVISIVDESLAEAMNQTSEEYPSEVDEFKEAGLTPVTGQLVKAPLVAESPVNMECKLVKTMEFGEVGIGYNVVIGEIVIVHIKDEYWSDDHVEPSKLKAIGRLGGDFYCRISDLFEMKRPGV